MNNLENDDLGYLQKDYFGLLYVLY